MKINFYLKSKAKTNGTVTSKKSQQATETYIEMRCRYDGKTFIYGTNVYANLNEWDKGKQRFKYRTLKQTQNKNDYLDYLEKELEDLYLQNKAKGVLLPLQQFREEFKKRLVKNSRKEKTLLEYFLQDFIKAKQFEAAAKDRVEKSTVARYKVVGKHLEIYQSFKNVTLTFDMMTKEFYNDFVNYFTFKYTYQKGKQTFVGLEDSTIGNSVKSLKVFLKWAQEAGLHSNDAYRRFVAEKPVDELIIAMTNEELKQITDADLGGNEKLEQVRDIFVFGCALGARVSDLLVLTKDNVVDRDGTRFIDYLPKKTIKHRTSALSVPIIKAEALAVISKYEGRFDTLLPTISDVKLNKHLKELGRIAKINTQLKDVKIKGGQRVVIGTKPKYKLMASHIMRKTFITQALKSGMPAQLVMECSGHTDYKSFQRYIDFSNSKDKADAFKKYSEDTTVMKIVA